MTGEQVLKALVEFGLLREDDGRYEWTALADQVLMAEPESD